MSLVAFQQERYLSRFQRSVSDMFDNLVFFSYFEFRYWYLERLGIFCRLIINVYGKKYPHRNQIKTSLKVEMIHKLLITIKHTLLHLKFDHELRQKLTYSIYIILIVQWCLVVYILILRSSLWFFMMSSVSSGSKTTDDDK